MDHKINLANAQPLAHYIGGTKKAMNWMRRLIGRAGRGTPALDVPIQCANCTEVFESSVPPEYNGEVLIIGVRQKEDFLIAAGTVENFKTWDGRQLMSSEGLSAGMMEEVEDRDKRSYCQTFCHSDKGRIVVSIRHARAEVNHS